jgi:putative endopeptidase
MFNKGIALIMILGAITACNKSEKPMQAINLNDMDISVKPQDDFYRYANGGWMKAHPLPEEYSRYGSFDKLQEDNDKMLHALVEDLSKNQSSDAVGRKIGDFYASGMDSAAIEKEGISSLKPYFDKISQVKTFADVQKLIAEFHKMGVSSLFNFYGEPDSKNSEMMIGVLYQGGLGLSDRDYYVSSDKRAVEIRTEYVKHLQRMFELLGVSKEEAAKKADRVMKFETKLAGSSITRLEERDPEKNYNKKTYAEVKKLVSAYDWDNYFKSLGLSNPGDMNVSQVKFFTDLNKLLPTVDIDTWKDYLSWNLIDNTASYLDSKFVTANFEFYGKFLSGQPKIKPRWKRVLGATNNTVGEAVGQMFVKKYFPPQAKERMLKLVENLRESLGERIKNLDWMGDSTKQKALDKLAAIRVKIGYPDKWRDFSGLKVQRGSYVLNVLEGNKFETDYQVNKIGKPVNKDEWFMTPQTVNAYYSPNLNEICFPAGILQPPFFFMNADDAVNYGAIGVVIGHEITHGFDDQGRLFDKVGNLTNWWTEDDAKHFKDRSQVLVNQFSQFTVLDSVKADGALTLGENIADLGGLNISFGALQKSLKENPVTEKIDGFTPEQRFFLAYAHVWGQNIRNQEILRRTKEDVHSLGEFRVKGPLPNMPEFHAAFGIKEGDKMYIAKDKRAIIW